MSASEGNTRREARYASVARTIPGGRTVVVVVAVELPVVGATTELVKRSGPTFNSIGTSPS